MMHLFVRENCASVTAKDRTLSADANDGIARWVNWSKRKEIARCEVVETQGTPDAYLVIGGETSQANDRRKGCLKSVTAGSSNAQKDWVCDAEGHHCSGAPRR
jgi:hypothetical protein